MVVNWQICWGPGDQPLSAGARFLWAMSKPDVHAARAAPPIFSPLLSSRRFRHWQQLHVMASALFNIIPQEIVDSILESLPDGKDRLHLSTTSRALRAKTRKKAYESLELFWEGNATESEIREESSKTLQAPRLDLLIRTLVEDTQLAENVLKLELQAAGFRGLSGLWFKPSQLAILEANSLHQLAARSGLDWQDMEGFATALGEGDTDAFIALLLSVLPGLTTLTVGLDVIRKTRFLPQVLSRLISPRANKLCQKVKRICLGPQFNNEDPYRFDRIRRLPRMLDWRNYLSYLFLPDLEELEMNLLEPVAQQGLRLLPCIPQVQNLRTLQLIESTIKPSTLGQLLSGAPSLARLDYEFSFSYSRYLDCAELIASLQHVRLTLQRLSFVCYVFSLDTLGPEGQEMEYVVDCASFANFPRLEILHISPCVLFGWTRQGAPLLEKLLPHQLSHLHLSNEFQFYELYDWNPATLTEYLDHSFAGQNWRHGSYQLRELCVTNKNVWFSDSERDVTDALCQRHAVKFGLA